MKSCHNPIKQQRSHKIEGIPGLSMPKTPMTTFCSTTLTDLNFYWVLFLFRVAFPYSKTGQLLVTRHCDSSHMRCSSSSQQPHCAVCLGGNLRVPKWFCAGLPAISHQVDVVNTPCSGLFQYLTNSLEGLHRKQGQHRGVCILLELFPRWAITQSFLISKQRVFHYTFKKDNSGRRLMSIDES